ncbi:hypothetical protein D3C73_822730 [compost metagenome]
MGFRKRLQGVNVHSIAQHQTGTPLTGPQAPVGHHQLPLDKRGIEPADTLQQFPREDQTGAAQHGGLMPFTLPPSQRMGDISRQFLFSAEMQLLPGFTQFS